MAAIDTLKELPNRGREIVALLLRPRTFVKVWRNQEKCTSNKEVLVWALAFAALLFGLYSAISGKGITDVILASGPFPIPVAQQSEHPPKPKFGGLRWNLLGGGVGLAYPQLQKKGLNTPQTVVFQMGAGELAVFNVIPSKLGTKVTDLLLLSLYVYFFALCIYPGFRVWKARVSFKQTVALANLYLAAVWAVGSLFVASAVLVLGNILKVSGRVFWICYLVLVVIPIFVLSIRAFWSGFRTLSELSAGRFLGSLFLAWCISWVVFPIFAPLIFGVLRFQELLDTVL